MRGDGEGVRLHAEAHMCCNDGRVALDSNICENALRCVALGRRNYLFFGSDRGGEAAAIIYSLLGSCKLNGMEPEGWLRDVRRLAVEPGA